MFGNWPMVLLRPGVGPESIGLEVSLDVDRMSPGAGVLAGAGRYMGRPGVRLVATGVDQPDSQRFPLVTYNLAVCEPVPSSVFVSEWSCIIVGWVRKLTFPLELRPCFFVNDCN